MKTNEIYIEPIKLFLPVINNTIRLIENGDSRVKQLEEQLKEFSNLRLKLIEFPNGWVLLDKPIDNSKDLFNEFPMVSKIIKHLQDLEYEELISINFFKK